MEYDDGVVFNICPSILYCELYVFDIIFWIEYSDDIAFVIIF